MVPSAPDLDLRFDAAPETGFGAGSPLRRLPANTRGQRHPPLIGHGR